MVIDGAWRGHYGGNYSLVFTDLESGEYFHNSPLYFGDYKGLKMWAKESRQILHKEMTQW